MQARTLAAVVSCCAIPGIAHADVFRYDFQVHVTTGPLAGETYTGRFSYTAYTKDFSVVVDALRFVFEGVEYGKDDSVVPPRANVDPDTLLLDEGLTGFIVKPLGAARGDDSVPFFEVERGEFFYLLPERGGFPPGTGFGEVNYSLVPAPGGAAVMGLAVIAVARRTRHRGFGG